MVARYTISAVLALAVAVGLFLVMHGLVSGQDPALDERASKKVIEFVRLKREAVTQVKKRELPDRAPPEQQPEAPQLDLSSGGSGEGVPVQQVVVDAPRMEHRVELAGGPDLGAAPSDTENVPLVRVQPMYPREAVERRIEGWVRVSFTISTTGTVKSPRVVDSQPKGVFERAAIAAIRRWKYKPKVENGVAVESPGEVQLTFELEGAK